MILLLLIFYPTTLSHKINKIDQSSGLFFNNLGQTRLSNEKYTFLTYTNLTHIKNQVTLAYEQYQKSIHLCGRISTQYLASDCNNQLHLIDLKLLNIQNDFSIISHQTSFNRQKRGLVNLGGEILHYLFGTLDSNDAEYYITQITLVNDRSQTNLLLQKQIGVISSTITNFNDSAQKLNEDAHYLNENLQKFDEFVTQTTDNEERLNVEM